MFAFATTRRELIMWFIQRLFTSGEISSVKFHFVYMTVFFAFIFAFLFEFTCSNVSSIRSQGPAPAPSC